MRRHLLLVCGLTAATPAPLHADVTTAAIEIGAPGSPTCGQPNDPPTLDNQQTPASARVDLTYDSESAELTIEVSNTSAVTAGVPNPVITRLYFNLPQPGTDGLSLVSQSAASGTPEFELHLASTESQLSTGCFGGADAMLGTPELTVKGGIANPLADTIAPPASVQGPVVFVLQVFGNSVGNLNAAAFAGAISKVDGLDQIPVPFAVKFQAGGPGGSASGRMAAPPECNAAAWYIGDPCIGETVTFVMESAPGCHACLLYSTEPGPTPFEGELVPIGLPVLPLLVVDPFPPSGVVTLDVLVPDDAGLVGLEVFFLPVAADLVAGTGVSIGDAFSLTVCAP